MRQNLRNGIRLASVLVVGSLGLSACGSSTDTPEGAVDAFYSAVVDRDWEGACSMIDPTFTSLINYDRPQSCESWMAGEMSDSVDELDGFEIDGAAIEVDGKKAELGKGAITTPSDDDYSDTFTDEELVETGDGWVFSRGEVEDDDSDW